MAEGPGSGESTGSRRFAAFISYAHADAGVAAKLQSRLERYRLPKHIALVHADGETALGQIFRDREDLAAAPSLSDAIRAAITEAEALVVIASPDARASRWVGEEIALFRQLHPGKPVLVALVRGDPEEAFPAALTAGGIEPLAADLRAEGDGEALGFLKIVAGIAGVPLDALVQRDAQRRLRRVMWITTGALTAMIIMSVMTAFAIQSRNEAARQRAEAEGLVEYMLTDLREKLRGVGRLDVMEGVNLRAKAYYGDNSVKGRLLEAQVLHAMGEDLAIKGQIDAAEKNFLEAHKQTAALLETNPANADVIFTHAQSEYWVGHIAKSKRDWKTVRRHWGAYLEQARKLAKIEPDSPRSFMELGYAEGNLCEAARAPGGNSAEAVQHCQRSILFEERALELKPGDPKTRQDIANRHGWMAIVHGDRLDFQSAAQSRRKEATVMLGLLEEDPRNVEYALRYGWAAAGLAASLVKLKKPAEALDEINRAIGKFDSIVATSSEDERVIFTKLRLLSHRGRAEKELNGAMTQSTRLALEQLIGGNPKAKQLQSLKMAILDEK
jgi:tetratricopeptide (TPR) repeat protein